jgi:hypothetical protein
MGGLTENSGPRDDHSTKPHNGFSAGPQRPIYIHITLYTQADCVFSLKEAKGSSLGAVTRATQQICQSVNNAPIQSLQLNPEVTKRSGIEFADQKYKYGSTEP